MNRNTRYRAGLAGLALAALALTGCSNGDKGTSDPAAGGLGDLSGELKASGASFPDAYYQEVIAKFKDAAPKLTVTYNPVGSGTGKEEFGKGLTDFAGTDSLVKDGQGPKTGEFLYVPTVAAPITISYNLTGVSDLKLSPDTLAKVFSRQVKVWNDPAIAADNAGVTLPATPITVVHRSDGSGTTSNFTKYLAAASPLWKLGSGDTVAWPADTQAGAKNSGVAQLIKQGNGAIGYVDLSDAKATGLTFAAVKNKNGEFVAPTLEGATAALAGAEVAADVSYSPLNAAGAGAYPITAPTFLLVKTKYDDAAKAKAIKGFITYLLNDGRDIAAEVNFAVLPDALKTKALAQLDKI
ncbi:phosphate-binding protein [Pilimelia anulata]|uniref:Phosphate-binding protein n=1 Tax=Pilimelia anulata TaxID=53371 RepID=A0A8J3F7W1_9ACTN|nr:phosphate ABC transporter substrate-binding protein PstS [Pilimelia anulata]GGJ91278.1 phosphate-binding protein [Pilimelia anulata]